ncbi:hypothetical protein ACOMHN_047564 [Nucella lapillus]
MTDTSDDWYMKHCVKSIPDICLRIDFTQEGTGRMEGAPRCMTIVGAIRIAAPLPVVSLILAVSGILMCAFGSLKRNGATVIAAVLYILAGRRFEISLETGASQLSGNAGALIVHF